MTIPFMVISALGAVVFFGAKDNPVAALFCGLCAVYVCELFASLGASRVRSPSWERALGFVHIAVGCWLMYLTVAAALDFARGFSLPL
jgi:protein-S-isoprenylcysteine O-methyltransferase Ste14